MTSAPPPTPPTQDQDIRPIVSDGDRSPPLWLGIGLIMVLAVGLFLVLDGRRRDASVPAIQMRQTDAISTISAPAPLQIDAGFTPNEASFIPPPPPPPPPAPMASVTGFAPMPPPTQLQPPVPPVAPAYAPQPPPAGYTPPPAYTPPLDSVSPPTNSRTGENRNRSLVIDTTRAGPSSPGSGPSSVAGNFSRPDRIGSGNSIIAQGTLIPAVLETALDSTQPGVVRAIVARDIRGFDGRQVLVPRGSRIFGEYQADLSAGQNRALIQWSRLVRPDGLTIALGSPAADLQGRIGIQGRVDNHFLQRFGSALLQTTVSLGTAIAGRSIGGDGAVILALPGSIQNTGPTGSAQRLIPTLRVPAGASVSVLVARDLDFATASERS